MKPLGYFVLSAACTGAGIVIGMWMAHDTSVPNIEAKCADSPLACAKRTAENRCGGPGTYQLVGVSKSDKPKFVFVCVRTEPV